MYSMPNTTPVRVVNVYRQAVTQFARLARIGGWAILSAWVANVAALHGHNKTLSVAALVGALEVAFRQVVPATDEASIAAKVLKAAANFVEPPKPPVG